MITTLNKQRYTRRHNGHEGESVAVFKPEIYGTNQQEIVRVLSLTKELVVDSNRCQDCGRV